MENILNALKTQRPNDKVIKILSNKFAIVEAAYTDGTYSKKSVYGLHNKIVYCYGQLDRIENFYTSHLEGLKNGYQQTAYDRPEGGIIYKRHFIKHNRQKRQYRKILNLIK